MNKYLTALILLIIITTGCEKTEQFPLNLKGTIKGEIIPRNEFGPANDDYEGFSIQLEGSEPLISTSTDIDGNYELKNIPTGTYNLIISKEGYGEYQKQGLQIVGGDEPLYFKAALNKKSSTTIENISHEIVNGTEIYLRGTVYHNIPFDIPTVPHEAVIRYFVHGSENPSGTDYSGTNTLIFNGESGTQFNYRINIDKKKYPSGSTIYLIAYGCSYYDLGFYDLLSNLYIYSSIGTGSNIASITIP